MHLGLLPRTAGCSGEAVSGALLDPQPSPEGPVKRGHRVKCEPNKPAGHSPAWPWPPRSGCSRQVEGLPCNPMGTPRRCSPQAARDLEGGRKDHSQVHASILRFQGTRGESGNPGREVGARREDGKDGERRGARSS